MQKQYRRPLTTLCGIVLIIIASFAPVSPVSVSASSRSAGLQHRGDGHEGEFGSVPGVALLPQIATRPQRKVTLVPGQEAPLTKRGKGALAVTPGLTNAPRDMKILVISATPTDQDLPAIKAALDQIGVPYAVFVAYNNGVKSTLSAAMLSNATKSFFQGVILTSGSLVNVNGVPDAFGNYPSAFTAAEWQTLWDWEATFRIRQVTSYTSPYSTFPESYGLAYAGEYRNDQSTHNDPPISASLTAAGREVFWYLNQTSPLLIKNAWTYYGTVISPTTTVPLLLSPEGYALASVTSYPDGRQNLALTFPNAPWLVHTQALYYGIINWVTRGIFLGERHTNLNIQIDDLYLETDLWNPDPAFKCADSCGLLYRLTGNDINKLVAWQDNIRATEPQASSLLMQWAYNGVGSTASYWTDLVETYAGDPINGQIFTGTDTLVSATLAHKAKFTWENHTLTHLNLDNATYAQVRNELAQNHTKATQLALPNYYRDTMVQPDISGLTNTNFYNAARDFGIRYIIADTSRPGWDNPSPNAGFNVTLTSAPNMTIVPRRPTNLFYPVSTPEEWVDMYNCFYYVNYVSPPGACANGQFRVFSSPQTYAQILDHESNFWLSYLLKGDLDPLMFHTGNVRAYDAAGKTTLSDLFEATLAKYKQVVGLNIRNLDHHTVGVLMRNRMNYNRAAVNATLTPCRSIVIRSPTNASLAPVTGLSSGGTLEVYGGKNITYVTLSRGQTKTIALPACTSSAVADATSGESVDTVLSGRDTYAPDSAPEIEEAPAIDDVSTTDESMRVYLPFLTIER